MVSRAVSLPGPTVPSAPVRGPAPVGTARLPTSSSNVPVPGPTAAPAPVPSFSAPPATAPAPNPAPSGPITSRSRPLLSQPAGTTLGPQPSLHPQASHALPLPHFQGAVNLPYSLSQPTSSDSSYLFAAPPAAPSFGLFYQPPPGIAAAPLLPPNLPFLAHDDHSPPQFDLFSSTAPLLNSSLPSSGLGAMTSSGGPPGVALEPWMLSTDNVLVSTEVGLLFCGTCAIIICPVCSWLHLIGNSVKRPALHRLDLALILLRTRLPRRPYSRSRSHCTHSLQSSLSLSYSCLRRYMLRRYMAHRKRSLNSRLRRLTG